MTQTFPAILSFALVHLCPTCGLRNAEHLIFCQDCGARLKEKTTTPTNPSGARAADAAPPTAPLPKQICATCGHESGNEMRFCVRCGSALGSLAVPSAPARPVAAAPAVAVAAGAPEPKVHDKTTKLQVAPPKAVQGRLLAIGKDGLVTRAIALAEQLDIGRLEGQARFDDDRFLAARHARILTKGDRVLLLDLASANGVFRRLRRAESFALSESDVLLLGQQVMRFELCGPAFEPAVADLVDGSLFFGTPFQSAGARLCLRTTEGVVRDVFYLRKGETVLGREVGDVVFTSDPFLSRRHAVIRSDHGRFVLSDLDSSNGTFVRIRAEWTLEEGDEFRVGQQLFRYDARPLEGASNRDPLGSQVS